MAGGVARREPVNEYEVALVSVDSSVTIIGWSTGAARLLGRDAASMIGRPFTVLLADPIAEEYRSRLRQVMQDQVAVQDTVTLIATDGMPLTVDVTVVSVQSSGSSVERVDLIMSRSDPAPDGAERCDLAARFGLNDREDELIRLLARGHRIPTIARELHLANGTVRNMLSSIYAKVGVRSQIELVELIIGSTASEAPRAPAATTRMEQNSRVLRNVRR